MYFQLIILLNCYIYYCTNAFYLEMLNTTNVKPQQIRLLTTAACGLTKSRLDDLTRLYSLNDGTE